MIVVMNSFVIIVIVFFYKAFILLYQYVFYVK